MMSTLRTMPLPSLLRTSLILDITLSERRLKYYLVIFLYIYIYIYIYIYLDIRSVVLDHLNLSKYIWLVHVFEVSFNTIAFLG